MAQNLTLDPKKKDYVFVNGSPVGSDRVHEAIYYSILIPKDNWLYGSDNQGSLVYTLENKKRTSGFEQQLSSLVKLAVTNQVINTGKAKSVDVTNVLNTKFGSFNNIDSVPNEQSISNQLGFVGV